MKNAKLNEAARHLIYLTACALHDTAPDPAVVSSMDQEAVFQLAKAHSMTAISCFGLEKGGCFSLLTPELARQWREEKEKAIRKTMLLDLERRQILGELEKAGIWYMPLKGTILKELYPRFGMRQMADVDILFDETKRDTVCAIFEKLGYTLQKESGSVHDTFEKLQIYQFEMHRRLFSSNIFPGLSEKYDHVKARLLPDPGKQFGFHFSDEDFYVYLMTHAYKHFQEGGTGLRTLVDFYVFQQKKRNELDWAYIEAELDSLGIKEYGLQSGRLAQSLFSQSPCELNEQERELLITYLKSGTYGSVSNKVNLGIKALQDSSQPIRFSTKLRYYLTRVFPSREWVREYHPFFDAHPWLMPGLWVYRIVHGLTKNRKKLMTELNAVKSAE